MVSRSTESAGPTPDDPGPHAAARPGNSTPVTRRGDAGRHPLSRPTASPGTDPVVVDTLTSVLAGLQFPAELWQILAAAEAYGADARTMTRLHRLPSMAYPSVRHVAAAYVASAALRQHPTTP